jgi:hypothetical protein
MIRYNIASSPFISPSTLLLDGMDEIPRGVSFEELVRQYLNRVNLQGEIDNWCCGGSIAGVRGFPSSWLKA